MNDMNTNNQFPGPKPTPAPDPKPEPIPEPAPVQPPVLKPKINIKAILTKVFTFSLVILLISLITAVILSIIGPWDKSSKRGIILTHAYSVYEKSSLPEANWETVTFLKDDRARMEQKGFLVTMKKKDGKTRSKKISLDRTIILRNDEKKCWVINNQTDKYKELSPADYQRKKRKPGELELEFDNVEQKNISQDDLNEYLETYKQAFTEEPTKIYCKKAKEDVLVNDWKCDKYRLYYKGKKKMTLWMMKLKNIGVNEIDLQTLEDIHKVSGNNLYSLYSYYKELSQSDTFPKGIPVKVLLFSVKKKKYIKEVKIELEAVRWEDIPLSMFELEIN